jgi:lysophospholipid acyltransferase (LPLAT)-like uncharacterized protein
MKSKGSKTYLMKWYDPILIRVFPPLVALVVKLLMVSCRLVKVEGQGEETQALARSNGRAIYATWHQRMSYLSHALGSRGLIILISESRDGEYGAKVAAWLGFQNIRGSSTRGGVRALRAIITKIKQGQIGGMLADGPTGPAREAKIGPVVTARSAGVPLIPVVWGADRCWTLATWDRYLVPKPFARVIVRYGEPIWVPGSARGAELEQYRKLLEERLNKETRLCDRHFGEERPWRRGTGERVPEVGPL